MSVYKEVPQLLPSATEITSSVPFTCYLILCHVIEKTTVVVKFLKRVGLYRHSESSKLFMNDTDIAKVIGNSYSSENTDD